MLKLCFCTVLIRWNPGSAKSRYGHSTYFRIYPSWCGWYLSIFRCISSFVPSRGWRWQRRWRRTRNGWSNSKLHLSHHSDTSCWSYDLVSSAFFFVFLSNLPLVAMPGKFVAIHSLKRRSGKPLGDHLLHSRNAPHPAATNHSNWPT